MKFKTEEIQEENRVLIIYKHRSWVFQEIKNKLEEYQYQVFSSAHLPKNIENFKLIFVLNFEEQIKKINPLPKKTKICLILFNKKKLLPSLEKSFSKKIKIININPQSFSKETLENLLWFFFLDSKENVLNLENEIIKKVPLKKNSSSLHHSLFLKKFSKKNIFLLISLFFLFIEFFFIVPLIGSLFFLYQSYQDLKNENLFRFEKSINRLYFFNSLTKKSYQLSRPVLSLFYLSFIPDEILALNENGYVLLINSHSVLKNSQKIISLVLKKERIPEEDEDLNLRLKALKQDLKNLDNKITFFTQKLALPIKQSKKIKDELIKVEEGIKQGKTILNYLDEILGKDKEKKYLILFQNNMELRPGGGFIGSFGILRFANYHLKELTILDVYDADGQLKAHIEPPEPIKKYLNQPHWFLRDSNFSPDFKENFYQAEFFLEKEMNLVGFDGGIAITTTAIKNILEAFGEIYLPDYQEMINKDNFYLKTQLYAEKDFFPGSTQKKIFLSSLVNALLINLEEGVSYRKLIQGFKKSIDEKQIVIFFKNENLDNQFIGFGWGGRLVVPQCINENIYCLTDVFFPIDANLGVNKANFFINRLINLKISIKTDGTIENFAEVIFKNEASMESFPGGTYKNYFQIYLPSNIDIKAVYKDNTRINNWDGQTEKNFKVIGLFFETPPQKSTRIKINYQIKKKILKGKNLYQLIVQKQIGSANNDFVLDIYLPKNIYIVNQNFSALAKDNHLVYNTTLSNDKIFFIELIKE